MTKWELDNLMVLLAGASMRLERLSTEVRDKLSHHWPRSTAEHAQRRQLLALQRHLDDAITGCRGTVCYESMTGILGRVVVTQDATTDDDAPFHGAVGNQFANADHNPPPQVA